MERGSLALFSCMLGLQTPCSQYLQHAALVIPRHAACRILPAKSLQVSILSVLQQHLVKLVLVFWFEWKCQTIPRHGWPTSNLQQATLVILRHQVAQDCAVINKGIKWSGNGKIVIVMCTNWNLPFFDSFDSSFWSVELLELLWMLEHFRMVLLESYLTLNRMVNTWNWFMKAS